MGVSRQFVTDCFLESLHQVLSDSADFFGTNLATSGQQKSCTYHLEPSEVLVSDCYFVLDRVGHFEFEGNGSVDDFVAAGGVHRSTAVHSC